MNTYRAAAALCVAALLACANGARAQHGASGGNGGQCDRGLRQRCAGAGLGLHAPWAGYAFGRLPMQGDPWLAAGYQPLAAPLPNHAGIRVYLPKGDAKVWIDGALMNASGVERSFTTPPLPPGAHLYRIRAEWSQVRDGMLDAVVQERVVSVVRNQTMLVDFTVLPTESIALPKLPKQ